MITVVDVIRGLSETVETVFGAPPVTKDLREGFSRPATFITPVDTVPERIGGLRHETVMLEIVRFEHDTRDGWIQLLKDQAALTAALEAPVQVGDSFHILPEDVDFDLDRDTMSLACTFTVELYQDRPADAGPGSTDNMDTLVENGTTVVRPPNVNN